MMKLISDSEQKRINRFMHVEDASLSLVGKILYLLFLKENGYVFDTPFTFDHTSIGKPYYQHGPQFNISHSGSIVGVAISKKKIGLDIENKVPKFPDEILSFFSKDEVSLSPTQNHYYRLWTLKEAYLKKQGLGISELRSISFDFVNTNIDIATAKFKGVPMPEKCLSFDIRYGYQGSLCYETYSPLKIVYVDVSDLNNSFQS